MATRKDLLKAQSFTSRRMIAAFVDRDPDDPTPPLRRVGTATFVSILLGVVLLAGTALFGLIRPGGGSAWKDEGVIVADSGSGVQFIYVKEPQEQLIPMANVASARLMAAGEDPAGPPRVVNVNTDTLKGAAQGPMMGIEGAPRQLPAASNMTVYPLQLCSSEPTGLGDRFLTLEFDADDVTDDNISLVARTSAGDEYLITGGKAHRLWREQGKASPLIEDLPIATPGNAWIFALPAGAPIEPLEISDMGGTPSKNPLNLRIGQLAMVEATDGGNNRYYIQLDQGLVETSYLDARLLMAAKQMPSPRKISESELSAARNDAVSEMMTGGLPKTKPQAPQGVSNLQDLSVCATYSEATPEQVVLTVGQETPTMPQEVLRPLGNTVDRVVMEPLAGGLLRNAENTISDATSFLVIAGKSYPIPDVASRKALGYGDVKPAPVPAQLLTLIPPGLAPEKNLSRASVVVMN